MSDETPKPKRRGWRWLVGGIVVAFLVFAWLATPLSPPVVFTTSEGHQITFLTSGSNSLTYSRHPKIYRSCYQLFERILPASLTKRLPKPTVMTTGGRPSRAGAEPLILVFEYRLNPDRRTPVTGLQDLVKIDLVDSNGHRFSGKGETGSRNSIAWEGLAFESFPRRDRTFAVHLTDRKASEQTASFEIPTVSYTHLTLPTILRV